MDSVSTKVNDLWTGVRLVTKVALDAGRSSYRRYQAHARGICGVCNNLQPYGHVNTLRESSNGSHGIGPDDIKLTLEGISTRDILDARTINELVFQNAIVDTVGFYARSLTPSSLTNI